MSLQKIGQGRPSSERSASKNKSHGNRPEPGHRMGDASQHWKLQTAFTTPMRDAAAPMSSRMYQQDEIAYLRPAEGGFRPLWHSPAVEAARRERLLQGFVMREELPLLLCVLGHIPEQLGEIPLAINRVPQVTVPRVTDVVIERLHAESIRQFALGCYSRRGRQRNASCGTSTEPSIFMRFLPAFWCSRSCACGLNVGPAVATWRGRSCASGASSRGRACSLGAEASRRAIAASALRRQGRRRG